MLDLRTHITRLKRPKLLVKAAQIGLKDYRRKIHLARILQGPVPAKSFGVIAALCDLENHLNSLRKTRDAAYSTARHVEVLIALIAEEKRYSLENSQG